MDLPMPLKEKIEEKAAACSQAKLVAAAQAISLRYRQESGKGNRLLTEDLEALAYAIARMPATFGAVCTALGHTMNCYHEPIRSVLDVGAGTGAVCWAVRENCPDAEQFTCLERERAMSKLGQELMTADPVLEQAAWLRQDLSSSEINCHADLVCESYALNELSDSARENVVSQLWDAADGLLLLIEPGTPVGFSHLKKAREQLLQKGGHVVAPCPHSETCPLGDDDWCQFTCRVSRSRLQKALKGGDAPFEDEKFSFLAVSKTPVEVPTGRILRHPAKASGHIGLRLCTADGICDVTVTKKHGSLYKLARKAESGDAFPADELK